MGFEVKEFKNQYTKAMESTIKNYVKDPTLKDCDINITVIMSHGDGNHNTYVKTSDEGKITVEWILNQFNNSNCDYLAGKPKIFIIQCCRGPAKDEETDTAVNIKTIKLRCKADILLAFATVPGYVSYRRPDGSRFINAICDIFMEHAHDTNIEDLLKMVDNRVKHDVLRNTRGMQTCCYENRGFKRCFLNPI